MAWLDDVLSLCNNNTRMCNALVLSVVVVSFLQLLKHVLLTPSRLPLPPGPRNLPVVGSAHRLVNTLAHRVLRDLADVHGPLMHLRVGQVPVVVVTSKELARDILKTHDANFARGPSSSPAASLCIQEILSAKRILSFEHVREDEVRMLADEIRAVGPSVAVDLSARLHRITNTIVSRAAFGNKRSNAADFLVAIKQSVIMASGFYVPDLFPRFSVLLCWLTGMRRTLHGIRDTIDSILEEIISEKEEAKQQQDNNLVDVLLSLKDKGDFGFPITRDTIKAIVLDIFAGGSGTSANAMEWAMSELMITLG
uniref:Cytochrome P450 n=1 Tax=Oryza barthii TaxID=65489 RepID=A0A0D3HX87_9ORYZ